MRVREQADRFLSEEVSQDEFLVRCPERRAHLEGILKVAPGDAIRSAVVGRGLAPGRIERTGPDGILVSVPPPFERPVEMRRVHLFAALSRPPTVGKLLEHATAMGASSFRFFQAEKSQKSYGDSKVFKPENVRKFLMRGLAQSGRLWELPDVALSRRPLADAFRSGEADAPESVRILLSPGAAKPLDARTLAPAGDVSLAVGPEGGWTPGEEKSLEALGFVPVKLSRHVLRVETAVFAALSQIELLSHGGGAKKQ